MFWTKWVASLASSSAVRVLTVLVWGFLTPVLLRPFRSRVPSAVICESETWWHLSLSFLCNMTSSMHFSVCVERCCNHCNRELAGLLENRKFSELPKLLPKRFQRRFRGVGRDLASKIVALLCSALPCPALLCFSEFCFGSSDTCLLQAISFQKPIPNE